MPRSLKGAAKCREILEFRPGLAIVLADFVWYGYRVWVARDQFERHKARSEQLDAVIERARKQIAREIRARADAERRCAEMADKLVALANRPVQVIPPPDVSGIIRETVEGLATVVNGWKNAPIPEPTVQTALSMDQQGLDDRAGVPQQLWDFQPPWEQGFDAPNRAEFANARIGEYKPYVPGEGNTTAPKGGME